MKPVLGTAFGRTADWKHLRLVCWDCEENEVLVPATIAMEDFHAEQKKFSEAHRPCRNGQDEPDLSQTPGDAMTREQLDNIRARVEAATPGLWEPSSDTLTWIHVEAHGLTVAECRTYLNRQHSDEQNDANAAFIASAREDVPALLAEVERLRDALAMAVQVSGTMCEKCGWAMKFPGEPCRCELLAEVERLTAERDEACRSREEARAYRDISAKALQEESERHAITRSRVQATLGVLWERGRIARGMHAATTGTALAETVTEVFDRLDRARGEIERLTADPLPAAAWVREVERAAFSRGVAAMREAAVAVASKRADLPKHSDLDSAWCRSAERILDELRHLPDPEDKR